jgi:hypothetical protein
MDKFLVFDSNRFRSMPLLARLPPSNTLAVLPHPQTMQNCYSFGRLEHYYNKMHYDRFSIVNIQQFDNMELQTHRRLACYVELLHPKQGRWLCDVKPKHSAERVAMRPDFAFSLST